jgi:lipopolysaccharide/colanic/teichoic acid biosynthesis glycosyltransferase
MKSTKDETQEVILSQMKVDEEQKKIMVIKPRSMCALTSQESPVQLLLVEKRSITNSPTELCFTFSS